jgi:hypothetical protein
MRGARGGRSRERVALADAGGARATARIAGAAAIRSATRWSARWWSAIAAASTTATDDAWRAAGVYHALSVSGCTSRWWRWRRSWR